MSRSPGKASAARRALPLLLALSFCACRGIPYAETTAEGQYGTALRNSTRRAALIDTLETRAFVRIVYITPDLAEQQAERLSNLRGESPEETLARRDRARAEVTAPTFLAVVFTPNRDWNDWDSKSSSWHIALDTPAGPIEPVSVQRFERPFGVELLQTYPLIDDFHIAYRMQFARGPITQPPRLVVSGALGKMNFIWGE